MVTHEHHRDIRHQPEHQKQSRPAQARSLRPEARAAGAGQAEGHIRLARNARARESRSSRIRRAEKEAQVNALPGIRAHHLILAMGAAPAGNR